eukprot:scaffold5177_cov103-Cylindrotheca_fusiformis.AAC.2
MMFRRRQGSDVPESSSSLSSRPSSSLAVILGDGNENNINSSHDGTQHQQQQAYSFIKDRLGISRRRGMRIVIILTVLIILVLQYTPLATNNIVSKTIVEEIWQDPYWRAKIHNPFRTFHAMYIEKHRPQSLKTFHLTNTTGFVLNLDRDKDRLAVFRKRNPSFIQRFPAHQWTTTDPEKVKLQQYWGTKFPWIKIAGEMGKPGDAACSLSHLLLWKEKLLDNVNGQDYIFVFEDDIRIKKPSLRTNKHIVQAPDVADIVFLMSSATKLVRVPWKERNSDDDKTSWNVSNRVIGGYGAFGYIITRQGAEKMMKFLATYREPIDLSFFGSTSVHVYTPEKEWPLVGHYSDFESSRREFNQVER